MSTRKQQRLSVSSLLLLGIAFVVTISITNQLFRGWRIDLTENNLLYPVAMAPETCSRVSKNRSISITTIRIRPPQASRH